ncbi:subtilase-type proteinase Rrt12p [Diutina catenulata]
MLLPLSMLFLAFFVVYAHAAQFLVVLQPSATVESVLATITHGKRDLFASRIARRFGVGNFRGFVIDADSAMVRVLTRLPQVNMVSEDIPVKMYEVVEQEPAPRHLARVAQRDPLDDDDELVYLWNDAHAGHNVSVYIIDTGVNIHHPQFGGRARFGVNLCNEADHDLNGHGTHVAGLVASNDYGSAKMASIVAVKVLDQRGMGNLTTVVGGIEWAVNDMVSRGQMGVINMSLGSLRSRALNALVDEAAQLGVVVVAAAGNENLNACLESPASATGAIAVGAIDDQTDRLASFSNYGRCVDLFAPGVAVASVDARGESVQMSGTSMASPVVAGLAAIELSKGTEPGEVRHQLVEAATKNAISFGWRRRSANRLAFSLIEE